MMNANQAYTEFCLGNLEDYDKIKLVAYLVSSTLTNEDKVQLGAYLVDNVFNNEKDINKPSENIKL